MVNLRDCNGTAEKDPNISAMQIYDRLFSNPFKFFCSLITSGGYFNQTRELNSSFCSNRSKLQVKITVRSHGFIVRGH